MDKHINISERVAARSQHELSEWRVAQEYMRLLSQVDKEKQRIKRAGTLKKLVYITRGIYHYIYNNFYAYYFNRKYYKTYTLLQEATAKHSEIEPYLNKIRKGKC